MAIEHVNPEPSFRQCPSCGNPTPATTAQCAYCGYVSAADLAAHREEVATRRFVNALISRSKPFTMIFIGANAGMFVIEWFSGGMGLLSADDRVLTALGMKVNQLILERQEYWRLISCMFLHIGFVHLLLNNYALWIIGQEIETLYGSARFVTLYIATGLSASICSLYFSSAPSAGASGAIFGLFGVMAIFGFKYRNEVPNAISKSIRSRVIPIIGINLIIGFQSGIVDNSAHIGGLLAGIALGFFIPYKRPDEQATPFIWRALEVVLVATTAASLILALNNFSRSRGSFARRSHHSTVTSDPASPPVERVRTLS